VDARRILAAATGVAMTAGALAWTRSFTADHPFQEYGFTWLRRPTAGELGFAWRYLLLGAPASAILGYALAPWVARAAKGGAAPRAPLWIALAAAAAVGAVGFAVLHDAPVTDDEYVYLFQARLLTRGLASAPAPEAPDFFVNAFVLTRDGRWFGQYPPGHPLILAPFVAAGAPRLASILLALCNVWITAAVVRRMFGPGWAMVGASLLALSPLFLLTSATLLSHSTCYLGVAAAALGVLHLRDRPGVPGAALAGIGLGLAVVTRPYTGLTVGGVVGLAAAVVLVRSRSPRAIAAFALPLAVWAAFFLVYNHAATGNALTTGYQAIRGEGQVELGFGTVIEGFDPHTPLRGLYNVVVHAMRLHLWAFGWPLLAGVAAAGWWAGRRARPDRDTAVALRWAWVAFGVGLPAYLLYWSIGVNDTGPVKLFELMLPVTVLTTAALRSAVRRGRYGPAAWAAGSVVVGLAAFWPGRLMHLDRTAGQVLEPYRAVARAVTPPAVVFTENVQPRAARSWVYGRPNPAPDLEDPVLFVRDLGPRNLELIRIHPGRTPYRLRYQGERPVVTPLHFRRP
jgi:hypothetical protein